MGKRLVIVGALALIIWLPAYATEGSPLLGNGCVATQRGVQEAATACSRFRSLELSTSAEVGYVVERCEPRNYLQAPPAERRTQ